MRAGLAGSFGAVLLAMVALLLAAPAQAQYGGYVIHCESRDYRDNYCPVNTRGGVELVRQLSEASCHEGRTWGFDRRGIWVTEGCEGEFAIGSRRGYDERPYREPSPRYGYGGPRGGDNVVRCESRDSRYNFCPTRVRRDVQMIGQLSDTECRLNRTWGYDRNGIWVDRGCRADFEVR